MIQTKQVRTGQLPEFIAAVARAGGVITHSKRNGNTNNDYILLTFELKEGIIIPGFRKILNKIKQITQ